METRRRVQLEARPGHVAAWHQAYTVLKLFTVHKSNGGSLNLCHYCGGRGCFF